MQMFFIYTQHYYLIKKIILGMQIFGKMNLEMKSSTKQFFIKLQHGLKVQICMCLFIDKLITEFLMTDIQIKVKKHGK